MEITYYANKIKTLTLNPQSFAKGRCVCGGGKINCGTEACTVLRKAQEFSKAKASIMQESGGTADIMIILIFHRARHLLGNNIASLLHTINLILCSLSSCISATTAVEQVWVFQSLLACRGHQSSKGQAAGMALATWDSLGGEGCQGDGANRLRKALCGWFEARLPV